MKPRLMAAVPLPVARPIRPTMMWPMLCQETAASGSPGGAPIGKPRGRRLTMDGQPHDVEPEALGPIVERFVSG